jgi:hypothetical protein
MMQHAVIQLQSFLLTYQVCTLLHSVLCICCVCDSTHLQHQQGSPYLDGESGTLSCEASATRGPRHAK